MPNARRAVEQVRPGKRCDPPCAPLLAAVRCSRLMCVVSAQPPHSSTHTHTHTHTHTATATATATTTPHPAPRTTTHHAPHQAALLGPTWRADQGGLGLAVTFGHARARTHGCTGHVLCLGGRVARACRRAPGHGRCRAFAGKLRRGARRRPRPRPRPRCGGDGGRVDARDSASALAALAAGRAVVARVRTATGSRLVAVVTAMLRACTVVWFVLFCV